MNPGWAAACCMLAAMVLGGCSPSADEEDGGRSRDAADTNQSEVRTETTRVQVVESIGTRDGFDARGIYDRLVPGVVTIISIFDGGGLDLLGGGGGGLGSGFVLDGDGHVVTNAHVVTNGSRLRKAEEVYVDFADGNRVEAKILGTDPHADVALLKVDPAGLSLTPLELGSLQPVDVGDPVAAIGSPFGEEQSLSVGVVSAIGRNIESLTDFGIGHAIQTDAAINRGNSGGPLIDARGKVIGINAQIRTESGEGSGVGYAVPVDTVRRSLADLRDDGEADYGYLGVESQQLYPQLAERIGVDVENGALISDVVEGSPADEAGLSAGERTVEFQGQPGVALDGDVVFEVDGRRLSREFDLADAVSRLDPGTRVELRIIRDDEERTIEVELGARPNRLDDDE